MAADNTASMCGKCLRDVRDQLAVPVEYPREFFETDEFRAAFASRDIGKVFKAYRFHPHHLRVFGKGLNQELLGRWLSLTQAQVSKTENGSKPEQNLDTLQRYAQILHLPQEMLWFDLPGQSRLTGSGLFFGNRATTEGALLVEIEKALAGGQDRIDKIVQGENHTDPQAVDTVATVLAGLRRLEDVTNASAVRPTVLQQAELATILAENATGDVRSKSVGLLSEMHQYLGWLNIPDQRWGPAQAHLDRAIALALESGDLQRLSTALSFLSYKNLRRDNLNAATALNEAAVRDERVHVGLRTYLTFQRAELHARSGSRNDALLALREADHLSDQLPPEDELPDYAYWYTTAFFHGQRAFVLHAMGDASQAKRIAAEAIDMLPGTWRDSEWASRRRKLAGLD
ncbi:hypothetical protein [Actinokineospora inagensis]|uniref:hypothetical protein n=1 Tax=Actinokineospora inagensis TaxID=103730 RepID=UPI001FE21E5E|nr:hypothetical protein [Actinokineospora inagensis]